MTIIINRLLKMAITNKWNTLILSCFLIIGFSCLFIGAGRAIFKYRKRPIFTPIKDKYISISKLNEINSINSDNPYIDKFITNSNMDYKNIINSMRTLDYINNNAIKSKHTIVDRTGRRHTLNGDDAIAKHNDIRSSNIKSKGNSLNNENIETNVKLRETDRLSKIEDYKLEIRDFKDELSVYTDIDNNDNRAIAIIYDKLSKKGLKLPIKGSIEETKINKLLDNIKTTNKRRTLAKINIMNTDDKLKKLMLKNKIK